MAKTNFWVNGFLGGLVAAGVVASAKANESAKSKVVKASTAKTTKTKVASNPKGEGKSEEPTTRDGPRTTTTPNKVAQILHVYEDEKKVLYWPMDLPFWVRLATSPEDGGKSFLLKKIDTETSATQNDDAHKDQIKLEIPGSQFIRWMNYVSKDEVKYRFVADSGPAEVRYEFRNAPQFATEKMWYFGRGLTVSVLAKDEHAGVEGRYLAVNDQEFVGFSAPQALVEEHLYKLKAYALDRVGYVSDVLETSVQVDLTPPQTSSGIVGVFKDNILSPRTKIKLTSTDSLSGVQGIYYKMDGDANFKAYDSEQLVSLEGLSDGQHVLNFYGVDQVANRETPQRYVFTLNGAPPAMAHMFMGPHFKDHDKKFYISTKTKLKLEASSQVAVKELTYQVGSGGPQKYNGPFLPVFKKGEDTISYGSVDELNNTSKQETIHVAMDTEAPTTTYALEGPSYSKDKGVIYVNSKSKITLKASDQNSGVKNISYQINDEPAEIYRGAFSVGKEGRYLLQYWSSDNVDNEEPISTILVLADNVPPEIVTVFSQDALKGSSEKTNYYPPGTALTVNAIDNASGVASVRYSLDGKEDKDYNSPLEFAKKGSHKVDIKVSDRLGNISRKTMDIEIVGEGWAPVAH